MQAQTGGITLEARAAANAPARQFGLQWQWKSRYEWARSNFMAQHGYTSKRAAQLDPAFQFAYREIKKKHTQEKSGPGSKYARALEILGLRDPSWTWAIGDTPLGEGRQHQLNSIDFSGQGVIYE